MRWGWAWETVGTDRVAVGQLGPGVVGVPVGVRGGCQRGPRALRTGGRRTWGRGCGCWWGSAGAGGVSPGNGDSGLRQWFDNGMKAGGLIQGMWVLAGLGRGRHGAQGCQSEQRWQWSEMVV